MTCRPHGPVHASPRRPRTPLLVGMSIVGLAGLVGCDNPEVQDAIWTGANDLAVALIDALFLAIKPVTENGEVVTVSWLWNAVTTAFA